MRTMVFQHGLCGDAAQPAGVFPPDTGWQCVTLESRGHGASAPGPVEQLSIATFTEDLASWIIGTQNPPVVAGGISMGAAVALRLAIVRPDLVRGLVLARPAWIAEDAPPNMQPNAIVGELLRRYPPAEARVRFEATELAKQLAVEAPDNLTSLRSFFTREPIATTAELLCRISADGPGVTRARIAALQIPTLVIGNAHDYVHPMNMARELATLIPNATLVEITSKSVDRDRYVEEFRVALSDFLTAPDGRVAGGATEQAQRKPHR